DHARVAWVRGDGTFELEDIPPPPCRVEVMFAPRAEIRTAIRRASPAFFYRSVNISTLPAVPIAIEPRSRPDDESIDGMPILSSPAPAQRSSHCIAFDFGTPLECAK